MLTFKRAFSSGRPLLKNYGFIGLGRMGLNMAQNLRAKLDASDKLYLYDVNEAAMDLVEGPNVVKARSVGEVGTECENVVTMLPEGKHVRAVYDELSADIKRAGKNDGSKLFIDSSTIDVQTSLNTAKKLRDERIGAFVDAPVSGGVVGAQNATLCFMIGSNDLTRVRPVLEHMGAKLVSCGEPGAGISAKLANNYLLALSNIATAESFQLARKLGLDLNVYAQIVNTSSGRCWSSEVNTPAPGTNPNAPSARDYEGGFGVALMNKDLKLAQDAAKLSNLNLLLADRASEIYDQLEADPNCKPKDMSVVYQWIDK
jgi:3-hydroxyisobutyrate dehydrogenase